MVLEMAVTLTSIPVGPPAIYKMTLYPSPLRHPPDRIYILFAKDETLNSTYIQDLVR